MEFRGQLGGQCMWHLGICKQLCCSMDGCRNFLGETGRATCIFPFPGHHPRRVPNQAAAVSSL